MSSSNEPAIIPPSRALSTEEKQTAMWCHLSSLAGILLPGANILAPLLCWMSKKDSSRFVNFHGKESLNFQINMLLYSLFSCPFCCAGLAAFPLLGMDVAGQSVTWGGLGLSIVYITIITIYEVIISILASIKANSGEWYRYPFVLYRFFK